MSGSFVTSVPLETLKRDLVPSEYGAYGSYEF